MAEIDKILQLMIKHNASDLHLTTGMSPFLRVHGDMCPVENLPALSADLLMTLLKSIMPAYNVEDFEKNHETDFAYETANLGRFRVNMFMDRHGPCAVFRMIPTKIMTAEELNLPKVVADICNLTKGLVLVTGPTGSGKSTTLATLIDLINQSRACHIITIEDPIEFVHKNKKCLIHQRELHAHTSNYKNALRAALREDPDIILVGEMRDLDTIEIALETAETGHLVFGTLHTNSAAATVERIIDQFPGDKQNQVRQMLADSLKAVVSQTLLKRKDGKGRVAAIEILIATLGISNLIREGKTYQIPSAMQTGGKLGMVLLNDALLKTVISQIVTPEEAYLKSVSKSDFEKKLAEVGVKIDMASLREEVLSLSEPASTIIKFKAPQTVVQKGEQKVVPITDDFQSFRNKMFQKK